ncbi:MAG: hypothetical protein Q8Q71_11150 [Brevundimonas sp.]|nr:hypothetical protein [Brevundimonas sp.]
MGKPSKLSEAHWEALFYRDAAGEPRKALAADYGVTVGTIAWQARKRRRMKGQVAGAVDRRRRPEGGWPDDHVFIQSRSGMTPRRWRQLLARYVAGEALWVLSGEYGVSEGAISHNARAWGMRKADWPAAVYLPCAPSEDGRGPRPEMAFTFDREDPEKTRASLGAAILRALAEGRQADAAALGRMWGMVERIYMGRGM